MRFADLRERVVAANVELIRAGLVILTFGNASAIDRAVGVVAIKPSGVPFEQLDPASIAVVDIVSGAVIDGGLAPSSDTPTHLLLYRAFDDIGGIVHTHSPYATAWAQARRDLPCLGTTHADHFRGPVPVTRALKHEEIAANYEHETGAVIVETIEERGLDPGEMPAVLVASHGPFVWGIDEVAAVENAVALEAAACAGFHASVLHPGVGEIQDSLLQRHFERKHGRGAYYGQVRSADAP